MIRLEAKSAKSMLLAVTQKYTQHSSQHRVWNAAQLVSKVASKSITPLSLQHLLESRGTYANFVHTELPIRLARRVMALQNLPFIVGVNPHIKSVYDLYRDSLERILGLDPPHSKTSQAQLADTLSELTQSHQNVIATLAKGFMECGKYMSRQESTAFLDGMIHARIGIRVIAEHYLLLQTPMENWIGVIHTRVSPSKVIQETAERVQDMCEQTYGTCPDYILKGHAETKVAYITVHMEYIFMELIKNAMRATVEFSNKIGRLDHPPVEIAIGTSPQDFIIRIRDQGGGIPLSDTDKVWQYSYTTVPKESDDLFGDESRMRTGLAGLGFGLPMSRIYAKYFGGSLDFRAVNGHGTDFFIRFPNISSKLDHQI